MAVHGMRAFSIADIQRRVSLQKPTQMVACLDVLTAALRRTRGDVKARRAGHCLVAETTMRGTLGLWPNIVVERGLQSVASEQPAKHLPGASPAVTRPCS